MTYTVALQTPSRQQWEASSQYSQSWNCGPTCVAFIAGFYMDNRPAIEYSRRMISGRGPYNVNGSSYYGCPPRTPTNAWQQADMLDVRGVPSTARSIDGIAQLHGLVDSGRHPVLVGIEMSRVPAAIRGHSFTGWHAVVVICGATVNGNKGFWIMDPNFAVGGASRRFYSNTLMQSAWANNSPRWCVVPNAAKPVASPPSTAVKFNSGVDGVRIRRGPDSRKGNVFATAFTDPTGVRKGSLRNGQYIRKTAGPFVLGATVKGADGQFYFRIRVAGGYYYVQTRFMHRV